MTSNLDRFKEDLADLVNRGDPLYRAMLHACFPEEFEEAFGEETPDLLKDIPDFEDEYQPWYTEAQGLIKQLIPDRLTDFVGHYEKPKSRKELTTENYRIADYLQGLTNKSRFETRARVGPGAAIPHFRQQLAILKAAEVRFTSSLSDMAQLVQADLFDSELEAAAALAKQGFTRGAGAVAGVVLEKHLAQVLSNHNLKLRKKKPTIADFNDVLKDAEVLEIPEWRSIQYLADLRNLCDHNKDADPTREQVDELIAGVEKLMKTLF